MTTKAERSLEDPALCRFRWDAERTLLLCTCFLDEGPPDGTGFPGPTWRCIRTARSARSREVRATCPSMPGVLRPALRCRTVRHRVAPRKSNPSLRWTILVFSSLRDRPRSASHPASLSRMLSACRLLWQQTAKSSAYAEDRIMLTPGAAVSEKTVRGRLRMFVFGGRGSEDSDQLAERTRTVTHDLCGCTGRTAISPEHPFRSERTGRDQYGVWRIWPTCSASRLTSDEH
jgi:hypothetical protein